HGGDRHREDRHGGDRHREGQGAGRVADAVPARLAELFAARLGLTGPRLTFTNACVASAAAIIHACRLISSGRTEVAVCAGGYLVEEETFGKFDSGRALSRDGMVRPFSADRSGLLLGDGVAAVVLESAGHARRRGARPLATVEGWGAATDAYHVSQPHPEGVGIAAAARQALRLAGDPEGAALGYVNAHGTGTKYNDGAETRGLRSVLGGRADAVPVSSTKSTTGHLLEAAGVVEFVITLLSLTDGVLPPTAGYTRPDPECDLDYVPNRPRRADARRALTLNAAFGGANTALVLERPR
ncbi:beta-ketoacyl-[acyl-carrier-protein] synthase family protein, partial [Streptomyces sparsogenes]|uniref:beta-ketoacyl-[acyl-carrier-protein] synthase family protein n=1 Tax=Streptomyces sparsogenes TaxID=67365 RepID=UPI00384C9667